MTYDHFFLGLFLAIGATFGLSACHSYPTRVRYRNLPPDIKIIRATPDQVNTHCMKYATHWDDGTRINKTFSRRKIRCCYSPKTHVMYVSAGGESCIPHEMGHADRPNDPKWVEEHIP